MMKRLIWCLLGSILLVSAAWSQSGGAEQAVAALEQKWLQSQQTNNPTLLEPLLSDKFVNTGTDGKSSGKAETVARAKATKYASAENEDVKVTVFGDTAIATGVYKGKGTDPTGKPFDETERWTDTWVKTPGGWQCVASQGTTIKM